LYRSVLRPVLILFGLIALAAYASIMLRGPQGLAALEEKREAARQLQNENANLMKQIDEKKSRIEKLRHDRGTQEKIVRERTGKTRPGDTSFVVPDQPSTSDSH
jgi:cell division protein FtsB